MTQIPRRKRQVKLATPETLEKAAIWYLERYASSSANLESVLMRRVRRSIATHGGDEEALRATIQAIVRRFQQSGLLNDQAYAETRARSLLRQGKGRRRVLQALVMKGIDRNTAQTVLDDILAEHDDPGDLDMASAIHYARRRRIGPWRKGDRTPFRDRDLAALGRQGHDLETARRIVDTDDIETLEAILDAVSETY